MGRKLEVGYAPLGEGELGPLLNNVARAEPYLYAKCHLDPSNRLATIHHCYRQDSQDRTGQRSGSI